MRILLIEDNPADASLIQDFFGLKFKTGEIELASTLSAGIEKVKDIMFNLIILDLGLPDSDGINTFHTLRSFTRSPVVILTGHQEDGVGIAAVKAGAQDYLIKGTDADALYRSINYAIERHSRKNLENEIRKTKTEYNKAIDSLKSCVTNLNTMPNQNFNK